MRRIASAAAEKKVERGSRSQGYLNLRGAARLHALMQSVGASDRVVPAPSCETPIDAILIYQLQKVVGSLRVAAFYGSQQYSGIAHVSDIVFHTKNMAGFLLKQPWIPAP